MQIVSLLQRGRRPAGAGRCAVMASAAQSVHHVLHVSDKPVQCLWSCVLPAFLHMYLQCGQHYTCESMVDGLYPRFSLKYSRHLKLQRRS